MGQSPSAHLNELIRLRPPGYGTYELFLREVQARTLGWADQKPQLQNSSTSKAICVRSLVDGAEGIVTTTNLDKDHVSILMKKALEMATLAPKDAHRKLAKNDARKSKDFPIEKNLFNRESGDWLEELKMIEKKILKKDKRIKKVIKLQIEEELETEAVVNSLGVGHENSFSRVGCLVEVLAEDKGQSEVGWNFQQTRFSNDLLIEPLALATAEDAFNSLGGRPLKTGPVPVVLDPQVGVQLLRLLSEALSGQSVQLGRSFFNKKLGQQVASSAITITDDPFVPKGISSCEFDDEGTPHAPINVIENGVLKSYFYDVRSASMAGRPSTGHGIKNGLGSPPSPHPTNFFIMPGSDSRSTLLSSEPELFLIKNVMGLHMADTITGEFSLGASGFLYNNGKYNTAVKGVTISGRLEDLLKKISAVGSDLRWYGAMGTPSLKISNLMVAGT